MWSRDHILNPCFWPFSFSAERPSRWHYHHLKKVPCFLSPTRRGRVILVAPGFRQASRFFCELKKLVVKFVWNQIPSHLGVCKWFLARLLIFINKGGLLQLKFGSSALTFTCGHDNLKSFSCILPKFVTHVANDQISDSFYVSCSNLLCLLLINISRTTSIMAEQKCKMVDLLRFLAFYVNNDLVGAITWKVFHLSCSNLLCMLLISSSRTSSITAEFFLNN